MTVVASSAQQTSAAAALVSQTRGAFASVEGFESFRLAPFQQSLATLTSASAAISSQPSAPSLAQETASAVTPIATQSATAASSAQLKSTTAETEMILAPQITPPSTEANTMSQRAQSVLQPSLVPSTVLQAETASPRSTSPASSSAEIPSQNAMQQWLSEELDEDTEALLPGGDFLPSTEAQQFNSNAHSQVESPQTPSPIVSPSNNSPVEQPTSSLCGRCWRAIPTPMKWTYACLAIITMVGVTIAFASPTSTLGQILSDHTYAPIIIGGAWGLPIAIWLVKKAFEKCLGDDEAEFV